MRAHYQRTIIEPNGDVVPGCTVRVIDWTDKTSTLSATLFADDTSATTKANPFVADDGIIDFYLADPTRVRLGITRPSAGATEYYIDGADVLAPPDGAIPPG